VMFVANRGFIMALFFGLLCLYEHHQWRSHKSRAALILSALFLSLAVLAEEGGAATFTFIAAYALVLESGSWRQRALSLWPAVVIFVLWRALYVRAGYGVSNIGPFYLDPLNEPFRFVQQLPVRMMQVLGGQLTGVPPEVLFVLLPAWHQFAIALYGISVIAALAVFLPWVRRDKPAAFWFAAMVLSAMPECSLVPISKNFGFVAMGAYGLIASFVAGGVTGRWPQSRAYRVLAWAACALLLLVHVPGAIAGRIATIKVASNFFAQLNHPPGDWPNIENQNVIAVNFPAPLISVYVPGYKAYYHQPLPRSVRALAPAGTTLTLQRTDDKTLVLRSLGPDLFSCDDLGPAHLDYFFGAANQILAAPLCQTGDHYELGSLTVEVLESDAAGLPSRVAFRFDTSLDSPSFRWLCWDWRTFSPQRFRLPAIGQSTTLPGPAR